MLTIVILGSWKNSNDVRNTLDGKLFKNYFIFQCVEDLILRHSDAYGCLLVAETARAYRVDDSVIAFTHRQGLHYIQKHNWTDLDAALSTLVKIYCGDAGLSHWPCTDLMWAVAKTSDNAL